MSRKKRDLTADEKALWRRVAAGMKARKPLALDATDAPEDRPADRASPKSLRAVSQLKPAVSKISQSAPPSLSTRPKPEPLANRGGEKRVRRGKLEIGANLDLHGHTQDSGRAALIRFLFAAHGRGDRTVIVDTAKGRPGEGVLKRALPGWLASPELKPILAGYAPAHQQHGGAGAFYVFLKARRGEG